MKPNEFLRDYAALKAPLFHRAAGIHTWNVASTCVDVGAASTPTSSTPPALAGSS